MRNSLIGYHR